MDSEFDETGAPLAGLTPLAVAAILLLVAVGGAIDLLGDRPSSWTSAHVVFEVGLMTTSLGFALYLYRGWMRATRRVAEIRKDFQARQTELRAERDRWRADADEAVRGFGQAIERQFEAWHLTPAEREVAIFLLRGTGHKQIAGATGRSERTVRQHAVAIYQKSGLGGRAELAAFFLEDLMQPR